MVGGVHPAFLLPPCHARDGGLAMTIRGFFNRPRRRGDNEETEYKAGVVYLILLPGCPGHTKHGRRLKAQAAGDFK